MHLISARTAERSVDEKSSWQGSAAKPARSHNEALDERALDMCEGMIDIAAALFSVSGKELRRAGRTSLGVSRVRQIAMYVAHVILRLNMTDIGRGFGRDRTTVAHACHLIEDLRDDEEFNRLVTVTERVVLAAFRNRGVI